MTEDAPDVLVAHDRRTGAHYARAFGMDRGARRPIIATRVEQLRGYGAPARFIFVNSDNGVPDPKVVDYLKMLEAVGCEVDWLG